MAGSSMTFTYDDGACGAGLRTRYRTITCSWLSDSATGAVTGTSRKICGRVVKAVTVPSGTVAPTDNYDIAITDEQSVDILGGCQSNVQNRDTANTEEVYFFLKDASGTPVTQAVSPVVQSKLTVAVTNAGNSKAGTLILYVEQ